MSPSLIRSCLLVSLLRARYLYYPLEGLYLVLITSKQSNILEDLETLKLISKLVVEYAPSDHPVPLSEEAFRSNPFDFISAVDEVISMGYRETVTPAQVKTSMEMNSHDYRLAMLIKASDPACCTTVFCSVSGTVLEGNERQGGRQGGRRRLVPSATNYPVHIRQ